MSQKQTNSEENVFANFLQTKGLYDSIEINRENINDLCNLIDGKIKLNMHCCDCGEKRIFSMESIQYYRPYDEENSLCHFWPLAESIMKIQHGQELTNSIHNKETQSDNNWYWKETYIETVTRVMTLSFSCALNGKHYIDFIVRTDENKMWKIGQYPSIADLTFPELDEYKKVLSKTDRQELGKAIGLHANGIGAGAYVYLRRIFERLLDQAQNDAGDIINLEDFKKAHVIERIKLLKGYLPNILTDNPQIYGILSKGVHELSEDECLKYFPVLKESIYLILTQWEQIRKTREKEKFLVSSISAIATSIN